MPIDFPPARWARVKENNRLWRERKLGRPLVQWTLHGADPGRPEPPYPRNCRISAFYNKDAGMERMLDRWDYDLSCQKFLGDAFPTFSVDFGPGVMAEALGGRVEPNTDGHIWFYPGAFEGVALRDMRFEYREDSFWFQRLLAICRAATTRFADQAQVIVWGLTSTVDVLATLRTTEALLFDLYDCPDEVERLVWEMHHAWFRYYETILAACAGNPGYSSHGEVFSDAPIPMLQCDFAYMIGPEMFDRFVRPELVASCRRMPGSFYHQDGVGQLPHTPSLHSIPNLGGIQWQPGDGHPPSALWHDVQRRIREDGLLSQTWGGPEILETLFKTHGDISNMLIIGHGHVRDEARFREVLRRYGIE